MRDYSKIGPKFWIGKTGKELRARGLEAQIVAMYLLTSPHANMLGLYYCPLMFIAHETGMGMEGANKGLQSCIEVGFCEYDVNTEMTWVIEMASYQIADSLAEKDLRVKGVMNEYASLPDNPYLARFYDRYGQAFLMSEKRIPQCSEQAPLKPLESQEQEQEQEQKKEQEQDGYAGASPSSAPKKNQMSVVRQNKEPAPTSATWHSYSDAYELRYRAPPVRNAKVNGQLAQLIARLGAEEAPAVAAFYVSHNNRYYINKMHSVDLLLADAEKLRTEWATGRRVTATAAQEADRLQETGDMWSRIMDEQGK
jgi:hypothetical protein